MKRKRMLEVQQLLITFRRIRMTQQSVKLNNKRSLRKSENDVKKPRQRSSVAQLFASWATSIPEKL
jgi:hypothetical protein